MTVTSQRTWQYWHDWHRIACVSHDHVADREEGK